MALSAGQEFLRMSTDIVAFFAVVEINLADGRWISPDISHPLGQKPSSPFEANDLGRIPRRFYDYSLDQSLNQLKGLAAASYFLRSSCPSAPHFAVPLRHGANPSEFMVGTARCAVRGCISDCQWWIAYLEAEVSGRSRTPPRGVPTKAVASNFLELHDASHLHETTMCRRL